MSKIITRADGTTLNVAGYRKAAPNPNAKKFASSNKNLPSKVDLRPFMTEVENQGQTSSCVANAVAGAYEYLAKKHLNDDAYDVSRLFIYYNARSKQGWEGEDAGSLISDAIESLKDYGACSEETWKFNEKNVLKEPKPDAYDEAAAFLVEDSELVPVDLDAWRACLAEGYPIIFGLSLFDSFDKHRKKGLVPNPTENEASRGSHAGHAMLCVGYSDTDKVFIVRNSWGKEWGDEGYCYIPYSYLMNKEYNDGDCWRIKQLENFEFDSLEYDDDSSLLGDYETELSNMSIEDYEAFLDALGDYPLEYRIGLLFLSVAMSDEEITDEEYDEIAAYMDETLEYLGSELSSKKVLKYCLKDIEDDELIDETIEVFAEFLSKEMLAKIIIDLENVVGVDEISDEEGDFIDYLVEQWELTDDDFAAFDEGEE